MKPWTEEDLNALGAAIDCGLNARSIAAQLGRTRYAVIGAANRQGWAIRQPRSPEQRAAGSTSRKTYEGGGVLYPRALKVGVDGDMDARVRRYAAETGQSLSAACRDLIEWGLEAME